MRYLITILIFLTGASCTAQQAPSAEQQILSTLDSYHTAEREGDIDAILDTYSDEFRDFQGTGKVVLGDFFNVLLSQGLLANLVVDMESMVITAEGDSATVGPVSYTSILGSNTYRYRMQKEQDAKWRIVFSEELN